MSEHKAFASPLGPVIARYLALKEALGRKYTNERNVLTHLDCFLRGQPTDQPELDAESFARWTATVVHLSSGVRRAWMRHVRNLCLYRKRSEPSCFVPDPSGFPRAHTPRPPHIFTEQQIVQLLRHADDLKTNSTSPLRPEVFRLAIIVLYTAGLRRGELVRLRIADYDPVEQALSICETKFHKSRLVPLSRDAAREMEQYLQARRRLQHAADSPLLCSRGHGLRHYSGSGLCSGLRQLFRSAGVRTVSGELPHVHDMRHSFAVHALLRWYRAGIDVQSKLPALAAYMGHVSIVSTQHYLSSLEPFAEAASERFAQHCESFLSTNANSRGES
ncbi:MAG: tyrosine-type recombinase/integrase [bacterium]|nr:tyrosine-type recombinase/integrase [bacterium]